MGPAPSVMFMRCVFRISVIKYEHLSPGVGERGWGGGGIVEEGLHRSSPGGVLRMGRNYDGPRGTQASLGTAELPGCDLQLHLVYVYGGLNCVPPRDMFRSSLMIPVTVTFFGNRVVADGICGVGVADAHTRARWALREEEAV